MFSNRITSRFHAFLVHIVCSIVVALLVLALVFLVWYPGPLSAATGVDEIFFLILGVDACLGPLLTLVVFNTKKKELRRDLLIIVFLQLGALVYGIYTVGVVRPAYVVFEIDRFSLVYANDLTKQKRMEASREKYQSIPYWGPRWVTALLPENIEERNNLLFSVIEGGEDLAQLPRFYAPYLESKEDIIKRSRPLNELKAYNLSDPNVEGYAKLMNRYASNSQKVGYLPLKGFTTDLVVVIDNTSAEVLELVKLRPWGD